MWLGTRVISQEPTVNWMRGRKSFLENIFGCPQQQIEELQGFLNPGLLISAGSDATHQFTLAGAMGVLGESEKSLQVVDNLIRRHGESTYIKTATQKLKKDMPYEYQRNPHSD